MIHVVDLNYLGRPRSVAAFVVESNDGPVLVETGPFSTFANLKVGLNACGYDIDEIRNVLITHIHLDHAGSAWALAERGATVYLHPSGYRHMADPSKLYASAKRIYGEDMDRLWGILKPIPENRLQRVENGESINIGGRRFVAHHTPGHAVHHIAWQLDRVLFAGDVAGVLIDDIMVQPPCPPPDICLEDWEASILQIKAMELDELYLTHFGVVKNIAEHLDALQARLWEWAAWIRSRREAGQSIEEVTSDFQSFADDQLRAHGGNDAHLALYDAANPAWMSVAGLYRYWKKRCE